MKNCNWTRLAFGGCALLSAFLVACGGGSGGTTQTPTAGVSGGGPTSPAISGNPSSTVTQEVTYNFLPVATDPNGDSLTFSIENQPSWASFDSATGMLSGTPGVNDVGSYSGIVISVSDGSENDSLSSFSIDVLGTATGAATLSWAIPTQNVDGTPLTDLAGFEIRYGMSSGSYDNVDTIANSSISTHMVENLSSATWFFVVVAYDTSGNTSELSNEASKTI